MKEELLKQLIEAVQIQEMLKTTMLDRKMYEIRTIGQQIAIQEAWRKQKETVEIIKQLIINI